MHRVPHPQFSDQITSSGWYSHWNNQLSNTWLPLFTKDKCFFFVCLFVCFVFNLNLQTCIRLPSFLGGSDSKESACNAGDLGLIPESKRSPGEGNGYLLQYSMYSRIPWTEEPGRLQSMGSQRIGLDLACMQVSFIFSSVRERLIEFRFMTNKKHKTKQKTENEIRDNSK